jgi:8-oxo-dGTP pyrophosphatase MutT (NUDIX family)
MDKIKNGSRGTGGLSRPINVEAETKRHDMQNVPLKAMLINMEGEKNLSLHEPIGIEIIAARLKNDLPDVEVRLYDTQGELAKTGKINTDALTMKILDFADSNSAPLLLGISVPIFAWEYTKSLLIKLEAAAPKSPMTIVLGNSIPTYAPSALITREFPNVRIVKGEGEEAFSYIARRIVHKQPIDNIYEPDLSDLMNYIIPYRVLTKEIGSLGGSIKVEASRGCDFGKCTMCSRCTERGKDYRTVPESKIVETLEELISHYGISRFELTDEEAFADVRATKRIIRALEKSGLPRIPFSASLRVDAFNKLKQEGLIPRLQKIGLEKIFLGVEGGSDEYLKTLGKKQKIAEAYTAIDSARSLSLDYEIGFITFSWRMSFEMLKKNIEFISEGDNIYHISSMANKLEIRSGTLDEVILKKSVKDKKISYNLEKGYNLNDLAYVDVPFSNRHVGEIYSRLSAYFNAEANVDYPLKGLLRSRSLNVADHKAIQELYNGLILLGLGIMRASVGLSEEKGIIEERRKLVERIYAFFNGKNIHGISDVVKREALIFLKEDKERETDRGEHVGAMLVIVDGNGRILLVRPRFDVLWGFPGGGLEPGEDSESAAIREGREELGGDIGIRIFDKLPSFTKEVHHDLTTGKIERLVLHHYIASVEADKIDICAADYEIADTLWLSPKQIVEGKINVRENVLEMAKLILKRKSTQPAD